MSVTVTGTDIYDVRYKCGYRGSSAPISITWRRSDLMFDAVRSHLPGCVVDATQMGEHGGHAPREFKSAGDALRFIGGLLNAHDKYAKEQQAKLAKDARAAKASKAKR